MGAPGIPAIRQIMTLRPRTVGRRTSIRVLRDLFVVYEFNAFPVVDESDALLGIVTKLDLLRIFRHPPGDSVPNLTALAAARVDEIMRRRVVTVTPGDPVTAAVDRMLSSRLRSLAVVQRRGHKDCLVGIVSRGDVVRALTFEAAQGSE